jgi:hypothetical protein
MGIKKTYRKLGQSEKSNIWGIETQKVLEIVLRKKTNSKEY